MGPRIESDVHSFSSSQPLHPTFVAFISFENMSSDQSEGQQYVVPIGLRRLSSHCRFPSRTPSVTGSISQISSLTTFQNSPRLEMASVHTDRAADGIQVVNEAATEAQRPSCSITLRNVSSNNPPYPIQLSRTWRCVSASEEQHQPT